MTVLSRRLLLLSVFLCLAKNSGAATRAIMEGLMASNNSIKVTTTTPVNVFVTNLVSSGPVADVRAWGADSTGVADSLTAINNAISSLSSTCGTVYFPNGTYKFSGTITVPSCPNQQGIILYADSSTIYNTPTNADGIVFNGSWSSGMIGGQLLPGGSLTGTSTGKAVIFKGVHQQVIVHRVKFGGNQPNVFNYPVGLSLQTVYGALINFNTFSSTTSIELLPTGLGDSVSTDLMISNNRLSSALGGYVLYSAAGNTGNTSSTMWHNYIEGAKGYGVLIGTGTQGTGWRLIAEYYNNNTGPWDVSVNSNNTSIIGCTFNSAAGPRTIIQATTTATVGLVIQGNFLDGGNNSNVTGLTLNNTSGSVGNNFFNHWTPGTPVSPAPSYAIGPNWFDSAVNTFAVNISTPTGDYNGTSAAKNLVFGYNSSNTTVGNDVGMVIRNQNTTNGITAGLHFARASGSSGSNDYPIGVSIVPTFGPAVSNQYSTATLHVLISKTANTAPTEVLTILPSGNLGILQTSPTQPLDLVGNLQFSQALMPNSTAGSSGNLLVSQGANTAPLWQTPITAANGNFILNQSSLQSGAVFNISSGTLTTALNLSYLTSGSIVFSSTGSVLGQDNGNLFWDNTNKRLGVGTATPQLREEIYENNTAPGFNGVLALKARFNTYGQGSYLSFRNFDVNSSADNQEMARIGGIFTDGADGSIVNGALVFYTGNAGVMAEKARVDKNGNWGIGTNAPVAKIHMSSGTLRIDGTNPGLDVSNGSSAGFILTDSETKSWFAANAPVSGKTGEIHFCSNCTAATLCISTGTTAGSWDSVSNSLVTACN